MPISLYAVPGRAWLLLMLFLVLWPSCAPAPSQTRHDLTRRYLIRGAWAIERKEAYELTLYRVGVGFKVLFCYTLLWLPESVVNIPFNHTNLLSTHRSNPHRRSWDSILFLLSHYFFSLINLFFFIINTSLLDAIAFETTAIPKSCSISWCLTLYLRTRAASCRRSLSLFKIFPLSSFGKAFVDCDHLFSIHLLLQIATYYSGSKSSWLPNTNRLGFDD
jgi:hypothetical protein